MKMNFGWFFIGKNRKMSLWAKCNNCGKWNRIERENITNLKPLPEKPIVEHCSKCGENKVVIERIAFARKGMKEPKS